MASSSNIEYVTSQVKTQVNASNEISKVSVTALALTAGVIGCWATACLFAGTLSSGGPVALVQDLLHSIIG